MITLIHLKYHPSLPPFLTPRTPKGIHLLMSTPLIRAFYKPPSNFNHFHISLTFLLYYHLLSLHSPSFGDSGSVRLSRRLSSKSPKFLSF